MKSRNFKCWCIQFKHFTFMLFVSHWKMLCLPEHYKVSSRSFIVLAFTFQTTIHFMLILVGDKVRLRFILFRVDNKLLWRMCRKSNFFHIELPWHLSWKSIDRTYIGLFLDSLMHFTDRCVSSDASSTLSRSLLFYSVSKSVRGRPLTSFLFFKILLASSGI